MSERVYMMDCGDGIRRADNGAMGKGVAVKTANYTIKAGDAGLLFSNRGAAGAVTFTLPAPARNIWFGFLKATQQNLVVQATGGAKINGGTANKAYNNVAAEVGGMTRLISDGTDWFVLGEKGTWVNNNT